MKKPVILIVDDEKNAREGLARALQKTYEVVLADNGQRALEILDADAHQHRVERIGWLRQDSSSVEVLNKPQPEAWVGVELTRVHAVPDDLEVQVARQVADFPMSFSARLWDIQNTCRIYSFQIQQRLLCCRVCLS